MAQWQMKLDVSSFYHKYPTELDIQEVAQKMADALKKKLPFVEKNFEDYTDELCNIIENFGDLAIDEYADADEFDCIMEDLYDWADTSLDGRFNGKKLMWINTF